MKPFQLMENKSSSIVFQFLQTDVSPHVSKGICLILSRRYRELKDGLCGQQWEHWASTLLLVQFTY